MQKTLIFIIYIYQYFMSPYLPVSCRYFPTCSQYVVEALTKYGVLRGLLLGGRRICRCHPFCQGGYDPVPNDSKLREI